MAHECEVYAAHAIFAPAFAWHSGSYGKASCSQENTEDFLYEIYTYVYDMQALVAPSFEVQEALH